jgi:hypothetical protein
VSAVRNERIKLLASAYNTIATSSFTVGVITPIAVKYYNFGNAAAYTTTKEVAVGALFWLCAAAVLHSCAQYVLGKLT